MSSIPILKICPHGSDIIITKSNISLFSIMAILLAIHPCSSDITIYVYSVFHNRNTLIKLRIKENQKEIKRKNRK